MKYFLILLSSIYAFPVNAYPQECIGDNAKSQIVVLKGRQCNIKCLAIAAKNAPKNSPAIMDGMSKLPRQITGKCDGGSVAGHGTACFALNTIKFVTPCNLNRDLY